MINISITKGVYPDAITLLEQDIEDESKFDLLGVIMAINVVSAVHVPDWARRKCSDRATE